MKKINSLYCKIKLLEYWRFNRQCICADEVCNADILVMTKNNLLHEIEIKCNKYDLLNLEIKKDKHFKPINNYSPNYFSFAVPSDLTQIALEFINKINPNYGLIEININNYNPILIRKTAKILHDDITYCDLWKKKILYRLTSSLISCMKKLYDKKYET